MRNDAAIEVSVSNTSRGPSRLETSQRPVSRREDKTPSKGSPDRNSTELRTLQEKRPSQNKLNLIQANN